MNFFQRLWNNLFPKKTAPTTTTPPSQVQPNPAPVAPAAKPAWMVWLEANIGQTDNTGQPMTAFDRENFTYTDYMPSGGIEAAACAATACEAMAKAGKPNPKNASAISFLGFYTSVFSPPGRFPAPISAPRFYTNVQFGDAINMLFGTQNHITFFYGPDPKNPANFLGLGGNQGHKLCIASMPIANIIGVGRP